MTPANSIEKTLNLVSATITIITFIGSFIPVFNNNHKISLPFFFNQPLSLFRFLVIGLLILACSYTVGFFCNKVHSSSFQSGTRNLFYGLLGMVSAWVNVFSIKYICFSEYLYTHWYNKLFFSGLLFLCGSLLFYFIRRHRDDDDSNSDEIKDDLMRFVVGAYIIFGLVAFAY